MNIGYKVKLLNTFLKRFVSVKSGPRENFEYKLKRMTDFPFNVTKGIIPSYFL